jgi:hypothetical protein
MDPSKYSKRKLGMEVGVAVEDAGEGFGNESIYFFYTLL